ncbi:MAG: tetratricopeptide repeat protein [Acidobacteria bacterium]|nr:tetratricopeptide repeat protein [Acidobacteriota bacterium]
MKKSATLSYVLLFALALTAVPALADALSSEAEAAYTAKDWAKAARAYEQITQREPKDGQAWYRLGYSLHLLKRYEPAIAAYGHAVEINPANWRAIYNTAGAHALLGHPDQAFVWLNRLVDPATVGFAQAGAIEADADFASLRADARYQNILAQVDKNVNPCRESADSRQFDFWIGEWDVTTAQGQPAGTSSIQLILGTCVIFENWTSIGSGYAGKSLNIYNVPRKKWQQYWVDSTGAVTFFEGGWEGSHLRLTGENAPRTGPTALNRMTFTPLGPDKVRQHGEGSDDGGNTWTTRYDLIYNRKK